MLFKEGFPFYNESIMEYIIRKAGGSKLMDYDLIKAILSLLLILLVLVSVIRTIINRRQQIQQRKEKWKQLDHSGLSEDDKILEVFPFANKQMNEQVCLLILERKKITAIKMVRDRFKLELREAKEYVDAVERRLSELI
jgi:ribosomal protein L7/L12